MEEKCRNCKHIRNLKTLEQNEETENRWVWSYICVLFADEKDGWALNLGNDIDSLCECFQERKGEENAL